MSASQSIIQNPPKEYHSPLIVVELELETQAGSPLGLPDDQTEFQGD